MKRIITLLAMLCLLTALSAAPASADVVPTLPHSFYGVVEINNNAAPVGTEVEARGDKVSIPVTGNPIEVTESGYYGGPGGLDPKLAVWGDEIEDGTILTFYVDGESTGQTAVWHSGEVTELHLFVTIDEPSGGGGGGGVGGGGTDTTAPRISNVLLCQDVTETTADICWKTHEKSDSQVEYWSNGHKKSALDEEMVIYHDVQLTGLSPGTTYYYETRSRDKADNLGISDEDTFTTLGEAPAVAFTTSKLSISPGEVEIGQTVTINVTVTNTGNASGSYKVTLEIDGVVAATKQVTLKAGADEEVTFTTAKDAVGSYSVDVDGLIGSFTVMVPAPPGPPPPAPPAPAPAPAPAPPVFPTGINWWLIGVVAAACIVAGAVVTFLVKGRTRA